MKKHLAALAVPLLFSIGMAASPVLADNGHGKGLFVDRDVDTFAVLPNGVKQPEGITANPANGDIYVATFHFSNPNKLLRYNRHGQLLAQLDFGGAPLLGLGFDHGMVYILNFGASQLQRVPAAFNSATKPEPVATFLPGIGAPAPRRVDNPDATPEHPSFDTITFGSNSFPAPNAMEFDSKGNLYVSDSFQGAIYLIEDVRTCKTPCTAKTLVHDSLLATAGFPPFGANGLAFNRYESLLFIANTGDDRVLALDMHTNLVSVFSESLNGADGLVFDKRSGLLWVCTNQADEVVALNDKGRVVAKLGELRGIKRNGTPDGLLFPASPVIVGDEIFVTNLAIPLGSSADEPEADVTRWTISRMRLPHGKD